MLFPHKSIHVNASVHDRYVDVQNIDELSMLRRHFNLYYKLLSDAKSTTDANWQRISGVNRYLSGISAPFNNMILGIPSKESNWDAEIANNCTYFKNHHMPFVWYVDVLDDPLFKEKLLENGFKDVGIFQGVIGKLDEQKILAAAGCKVGLNCQLEPVYGEVCMREFIDLVCDTFDMQGANRDEYFKAMNLGASRGQLYHWVARVEGKVVACVSTLIERDVVSFWNGATLQQYRRQGLSTALRVFALKHAMSKGCKVGMSYLMAEGLALGICKKLGFETKWRFTAFIAP